MGDSIGNLGDRSRPVHQVRLDDYYMCKYPITQEIWEGIIGGNLSRFKGSGRPVEQVSWLETQEFINKLNRIVGKRFRLPSESEWEYAARGGQYSQGYVHAGSDKLSQVGWYKENSNDETKEVGQLLANELGLCDMSGNVSEWCEDDWHDNYNRAPKDGIAWVDHSRGAQRVLRGGSYFYDSIDCHLAVRSKFNLGYRSSDIGFRLVLPFQLIE